MELKIISKKEEPLLARARVDVELTFEKATPSINEVKDSIVSKLGKDKNLVVVKGIYNEFSLRKAKGIVHIYTDESMLKKIEVKKEHAIKKAEGAAQPQKKEK